MFGGVVERHLVRVVGIDHLAARAREYRVEPDHQAFILLALHHDVARPALGEAAGRVGHHAVPRLGGLALVEGVAQNILAVPEQLGVGPDRDRVKAFRVIVLGLPLGGLERTTERSAFHLTDDVLGHRRQPTRVGELGGPHDVHAHQVEALVVAGKPSRQLQALVVGSLGQGRRHDAIFATGLLRTLVAHGLDRTGTVGRRVQIQDSWFMTGTAR